jgi:hypothetical protein
MAAFAAGTKVRKKASPHPTEVGTISQKAGENVALNANCWDVYSKIQLASDGMARWQNMQCCLIVR